MEGSEEMCGFAAFMTSGTNRHSDSDELAAIADRMTDHISCRGPDDSGTWIDQSALSAAIPLQGTVAEASAILENILRRTIREHIVAAGSVAAGVPARIVSTYEEDLQKALGKSIQTGDLPPADKRRFLTERFRHVA